jgi:hypothetical protein
MEIATGEATPPTSLPVFFLQRRPEWGFTDPHHRRVPLLSRISTLPSFPSPAAAVLLFPRSAPPQIPVPSGDHYGRHVHLLHFSLPSYFILLDI